MKHVSSRRDFGSVGKVLASRAQGRRFDSVMRNYNLYPRVNYRQRSHLWGKGVPDKTATVVKDEVYE